ncbi:MAG TPA: DUF5723 family protein [Chitinophagales bacterium]|nr:DUF5723 family protein [Chitinophagales bacterium]
MNRSCSFLIITQLLSFIASAQDTSSAVSPDNWNEMAFSLSNLYEDDFGKVFSKELSVSGEGVARSSDVNLPFSLGLIRNKFLDVEKKNDVSSRLNKMNVLEFSAGFNLNYRWIADSFIYRSPALYNLNFSTGTFSFTHFTDDLFSTIFYGNAHFAGQTADFSKTGSYTFSYDKLSFSVQKKIASANSAWEIGTGISLLGVRNLTKIDIAHGTLFTAETGEYLDADYDYEFIASDSSNHGGFLNFFNPDFTLSPASSFDGFGAALDFQISFLSTSQKTKWNFYVNDLGFANWNRNTRTHTADSMIRFEGIEVLNLFSSDSSSLLHFNSDSILKITGTTVQAGKRTTIIPFNVSIEYLHSFSPRMILAAGISYRPSIDMLPLLFVKPQWNFNSFRVAAILSGGGNTSYALGAVASATIKKQFKIFLGSDNFLGLLIPKQTTSASLFLQAAFQF